MAKTKRTTLSAQLREAIQSSELSMLAVARGADLDKATMSRFMNGHRGLRLDAVDKIGVLLGLRLVSEKPTKKRSKR